jgi:serine/threonine protein kinase
LSAHGVYIAMDYLEGRDLSHALHEGWRPTVGEALRLTRRLADGLAHAHARGVVHGDVEPRNIFLTRSGRPKLMNFGIARAIDRHPVPELAEVRLATPNGQAPETLAQGRYDELTDVYSLGVVLYELLSGRRPFRADSPEGLRQAIAVGRHVSLSEWRPDLPLPLVHLVHAAMACDRAARPALQGRPAGDARVLDDLDELEPRGDRIGFDARPLRVQADAFVRLLIRRDPDVADRLSHGRLPCLCTRWTLLVQIRACSVRVKAPVTGWDSLRRTDSGGRDRGLDVDDDAGAGGEGGLRIPRADLPGCRGRQADDHDARRPQDRRPGRADAGLRRPRRPPRARRGAPGRA